jgi:hypothetical protein
VWRADDGSTLPYVELNRAVGHMDAESAPWRDEPAKLRTIGVRAAAATDPRHPWYPRRPVAVQLPFVEDGQLAFSFDA